ncbi:MAG TPA: DNA repair protein RecO, partial [Glaciecola sp.]|nr:DNA repair protein RecO [Glaciecola sp.]
MRGGNSVWVSGFVLHRRPYQETSFLVDMFTHELGKIRCVARGMRSAKSDRKSVLQPFQSVTCELSGKGELKS